MARTLVKLATNKGFDEFEDDDFGGEEGMDDSDDFGIDDELDNMEDKGRSVSGPRTKLASYDDVQELKKGVASLARSVHSLAQVQKMLIENMDEDYVEDEDPMDLPEDGDDDDSLDLSRTQNKATINKDDAASSFGEKDSNVVGNRAYDQTKHTDNETVINGESSAGPGPVSKSFSPLEVEAMINKAVSKAVRAVTKANTSSTIAKSAGPSIGGLNESKIDKGESYNERELISKAKGRSFQELNRLRAELGDIPRGIL